MIKDNIISFPYERRQAEIDSENAIADEDYAMECQDTSQFVLLMLEDYLAGEYSPFEDMDFRSKDCPEARDMIVIVNLISSMFFRYGDLSHFLHEDLEALFNKITEKQINDTP